MIAVKAQTTIPEYSRALLIGHSEAMNVLLGPGGDQLANPQRFVESKLGEFGCKCLDVCQGVCVDTITRISMKYDVDGEGAYEVLDGAYLALRELGLKGGSGV